ncbi:hypothetical protein BDN72DRAFT_842957 [Pluteus cervinus]|uniref:Uncharacterized protein n=1 Tax=Pluteus cervinus TaxID=181527 RepID=A0ACD3ANL8_9AGAR|nr:hypothetical protein BDN72DRAFT_842957 [Pluteus cervinus]
MQAKFLSAIVLVAASLGVSAAPTDEYPGGTYVCPETNWGGDCKSIIWETGRCQRGDNILSGNVIGSFRPNELTICYGYQQRNCAGNATWTWTYPGEADGGASSGVLWTGNLKSFNCDAKTN